MIRTIVSKSVLSLLLLAAYSAFGADHDYDGCWDITIGGALRGKALWDEYEKIGADQRGLVWWLEIDGAGTPAAKGRFVTAYRGDVNVIEQIAVHDGELVFGFVREGRKLIYHARLVKGKLEGTFQIEGQKRPPIAWTGVRAPVIDEKDDDTWHEGKRFTLFNGKDLSGWRPTMSDVPQGWEVKDGLLVLTGSGNENNLVSEEKFWNFELHVEFRPGPKTNSGIGLRGRYEVQILEDFGRPPSSHGCGALYGFIVPSENAGKPAGEWQTFDIRLVGREVTVVLNGKTIIQKQEIPGLTGAAVDANEAEPGPILLQSARGPVAFRSITLKTLVKQPGLSMGMEGRRRVANETCHIGISKGVTRDGAQFASPEDLRRTLTAAGYGVDFFSDFTKIGRFDALILTSGSFIPRIAVDPLANYLKAGGSFLLIGDSAFGPNGYELLSDDYSDLKIAERHIASRLAERLAFPHDMDQNVVGASPDRIAAFTHRIVRKGIGRVSSVPGQQIVPADFRIDHPRGCSVLPKLLENENLVGSRVFTRWTPLLRAYTTTGEYIGPVAAILYNHGGIYAGSAFAYWGPLKPDNFASDIEKPILLSIMDRLLNRTFIHDLLPHSYYNEVGKGVTLGAKATNRGSAKQQLKVELTIYGKDGRPIHADSKEITLSPRETQQVSFQWSGRDVGYEEFKARLSLNDSGKILDQQETDFAVRTELVIDDGDPGFRADGAWTTALSAAAYGGKHRTTGKESGATARWTPTIRRAGHYDVFARWVSKTQGGPDASKTKSASWRVHHAKGAELVQLSQRWSSGFWVYLGTFDFAEGSAGWVELSSAADGVVSADAVKLVYTDVVPPPSHGVIRVDSNGRYFEFEDGTPFLPIGHNFVRFPGSGGEVWGPEAQYNKYFARMHAHGENVLRFFSSGGLGTPGGTKTSVLERHHILFYAARKYGIYLNPALHNFHDRVKVFQLTEDFNRRTCQFLAEEFGGRESPVFSWDLCNDIPGGDRTVTYIKQMKTLLQECEGPYKHLINIQHGGGTSWDTKTKSSSEEAKILDFTTLRSKSLPLGDNLLVVDPEEMDKVLNERIKNQLPLVKKPIVSGESGPDFVFLNIETPRVAAPVEDLTWEKAMLQGIWVSLASGATPDMYFMGFFGAKNNPDLSENGYKYYGALSQFASRIQWNRFNSVNCDNEIKASQGAIRVSAIRDENLLIGFLMHDAPENNFTEVQPQIRIARGLSPGHYRVEWIDPRTAEVVCRTQADGPPFALEAPKFEDCIALLLATEGALSKRSVSGKK